ncbi:MAG: DNA recombination protein RmuC [Phycisphaerales bacterium]|nr:MAG: DNA recombination protein RmuC [Phycisphaerales bacterium]
MTIMLWTLGGVVVGALVVLTITFLRRREQEDLARKLIEEAQKEKLEDLSTVISEVKASFAALSQEALTASKNDFLQLAETRLEKQTTQSGQMLETKKELIDARFSEMNKKLGTLNELIQAMDKQRAESFGSLRSGLDKATQATNRLFDTTSQLHEALTNPQRRGQWGERMAEDVLRLAGFVKGVNYLKQQTLAEGSRPDFTFMLPDKQLLHMDVKFPLANYLKMLETTEDAARNSLAAQFLKDVRQRIREVTTREYIDPGKGTIDYVLVFIPNEQIYGFIHEQDRSLLDDALRNKVVLCSPVTLYAVLAVIRQALDNFRLEQASSQILNLLGEFKKQWDRYVKTMDRMGDRLNAALKEYHDLTTVRTRQLARQVDKIDDLRATREQTDHAGLIVGEHHQLEDPDVIDKK